MRRVPHLRWWIIALIFGASVLNYIDRQALSILAPTIQKELQLSNEDYATVLNLFLAAYTVASLVSGRIVDRLGVRASLALFVAWWSVANILTAFARSAGFNTTGISASSQRAVILAAPAALGCT